MYQKSKLHAGLQADCKVCTPEQKTKRRKYEAPKAERVTTLEGTLRRQISEEIGEDELTKEFRFALLQKFGMATVRIDRKVTKPTWKEEKQWRQETNDWFRATKGLVPAVQTKRTPRVIPATVKPGVHPTKRVPQFRVRFSKPLPTNRQVNPHS